VVCCYSVMTLNEIDETHVGYSGGKEVFKDLEAGLITKAFIS
jgi:hypothetical protein